MNLLYKKGKKLHTNPIWKGKDANYRSKHARVTTRHGRSKVCDNCNKKVKRTEWHCKTGDYDNLERGNWLELCPLCHRAEDRKNGRVPWGYKMHCIPVVGTKDGVEYRFESTKDAINKTGVKSSNIYNCLNGLASTTGGYKWRYEE